jgi:hypothetical protein
VLCCVCCVAQGQFASTKEMQNKLSIAVVVINISFVPLLRLSVVSLVRWVADSLAGSLTRPLATWAERVEWVGIGRRRVGDWVD